MLHVSVGTPLDVAGMDRVLGQAEGMSLAFYGAPRAFPLDGGRVVDDRPEDFRAVVDHLALRGVPFHLCCNTVLDACDLRHAEAAWGILEQAHRPGNGVVVARHWLANEIRRRFPLFRLVYSSIGALAEAWDEDRLFAEYDVVVCPADRTNDFALLDHDDHWGKLEVFLNNECVDFGARCLGHYAHNSLVNAGLPAPTADFLCPNLRSSRPEAAPLQPSHGDLRRYLALGVRRFKVIERTARGQDFRAHFGALGRAWSEARDVS